MSTSAPPADSGRVLSPHAALSDPSLTGRSVRIGGRVLHRDSGLYLADAFEAIRVEPVTSERPPHASIAVAEGVLEAAVLRRARFTLEQQGTAHGTPPEFERLLQGRVGRDLRLRA